MLNIIKIIEFTPKSTKIAPNLHKNPQKYYKIWLFYYNFTKTIKI